MVIAGCAAVFALRQYARKPAATALTQPPPLNLAGISEPDPIAVSEIEAARAEVTRSPRSADAWGRLGMMLLAHGAPPADANTCIAQAERLNGRDPRWPYYQGNSLLEIDPDAAVAHLARAAQLCRERPDIARLKLAEALLARGRIDDAEKNFRRLLEVHPRHPRASLGLARLAFLRGNLDAARSHLALAVSDPQTRKAARTLLAELSYRGNDKVEAERLLAEARGFPDDPPWPDPFAGELERLEVGRKKSLSVTMALMRTGRLTEAIRLLRETQQAYPESERVLLLLGTAHNMAKDWAEGEKVLREAAAKAPDAPRVQFNLGISLASQNRFQEAAVCFEKAGRLMPDDATAHLHLGICAVRLGDDSRAENAFRKALSCRPNFGDAHRQLGELLLKTARREEALSHLRDAIALNPSDSAAKRLLDTAQSAP